MTPEPQTSTTNSQKNLSASSSASSASPRLIFFAWLISLPLLLLFIGHPEVSRTQEARVLEVARQMLGHPLIDWLIPKINGDVRLQKPPMTYWLTALSYHFFGVSESTGRIPTAIMGWLTLAVTYRAAAWLFSRRAALLSAACLLGSYYFSRHSRLAETDIPATLFVTLAIYAFWRAIPPTKAHGPALGPTPTQHDISNPKSKIQNPKSEKTGSDPFISLPQSAPPLACDFASVPPPPNPKSEIQNPKSSLWLHLAALSMALCILSKGAPALFALIFFIAYALIERRPYLLKRFITSGAILTFAIVAVPWFLFAGHNQGWATFLYEIRNVQAGNDHGAPIYQYIPWFIVGTLPFTPLSIIAIAIAIKHRHDEKIRGLLIWLGAIALPLCITGNKQSHYLIPLLPIVMIFTGWLIDRWNNRILIAATISSAIILPPLVTWLLPNITPQHARQTASFVQDHFANAPLCFFGPNESVPLCFNLKRPIPFANDQPELNEFLAREPNYIIITIGKDLRPASAPSGRVFEKLADFKAEDQWWQFYKTHDSPPNPTTSP